MDTFHIWLYRTCAEFIFGYSSCFPSPVCLSFVYFVSSFSYESLTTEVHGVPNDRTWRGNASILAYKHKEMQLCSSYFFFWFCSIDASSLIAFSFLEISSFNRRVDAEEQLATSSWARGLSPPGRRRRGLVWLGRATPNPATTMCFGPAQGLESPPAWCGKRRGKHELRPEAVHMVRCCRNCLPLPVRRTRRLRHSG